MYYFLVSILVFFSIKYEINKKKTFSTLVYFTIIIICAFKYKMGGDWYNYQNFYENINPSIKILDFFNGNIFIYSKKYYFEVGYIFVNYFFYKLGFNYEIFQAIIIGSCLFTMFRYIEKKSANFYFAISILFFSSFYLYIFEPFLRQLIAIVIVLKALKYISKNKLYNFIFFIFLAAQFHKSAYLLIFIYFLKYIKINNKTLIFYLFIFYVLLSNISLFIDKIPILSMYGIYFKEKSILNVIGEKRDILIKLFKIFIMLLRINLILYSYRFSRKNDEVIQKMGLIFCIISYLSNILPIIERFQGYFLIPYVICLSNLGNLLLLKKYKIKVLNNIIALSLLFFSIHLNMKFLQSEGVKEKFIYQNYIINYLNGDFVNKYEKKKDLEEYFYFILLENKKVTEKKEKLIK